MDDLQKELIEAQLQKRILEDEKKGWMSYLEAEASDSENLRYSTPEEMAKAFLQERLAKLDLVEKLGAIQPELSVKDANIRSLEDDKARLSYPLRMLTSAVWKMTRRDYKMSWKDYANLDHLVPSRTERIAKPKPASSVKEIS
ncbi:hypothetical protein MRB53_041325 [Persea americana]|nr:hypothetical protein MRB53_041325 [Persea americana]